MHVETDGPLSHRFFWKRRTDFPFGLTPKEVSHWLNVLHNIDNEAKQSFVLFAKNRPQWSSLSDVSSGARSSGGAVSSSRIGGFKPSGELTSPRLSILQVNVAKASSSMFKSGPSLARPESIPIGGNKRLSVGVSGPEVRARLPFGRF